MILTILVVIASLLIILKLFSKLTIGRCDSFVCLLGKTALVTGGNSGIGYQTALILASRGCRVIIADKDNCDRSQSQIIAETRNPNIITKYVDLASLSSVRRLAKDLNETEEVLDILINNAGAVGLGNSHTEDGLHIGMQVNHFGPFLLTHLLIGLLRKSQSGRIVFVTSIAAFVSYLTIKNLNFPSKIPSNILTQYLIYANSKLCNVITANTLAIKLKEFGITVNSVYPGIVDTPIFKKGSVSITKSQKQNNTLYLLYYYLLRPFSKTPMEGGQTIAHAALSKELQGISRKYLIDCKPFIMPPPLRNRSFCKEIWTLSENYVQLSTDEKL